MREYDARNTGYHPGTTGPKKLDTEKDVVWEFPDPRTNNSEAPEPELMSIDSPDSPTLGEGEFGSFSSPTIADGVA